MEAVTGYLTEIGMRISTVEATGLPSCMRLDARAASGVSLLLLADVCQPLGRDSAVPEPLSPFVRTA
jgi:hypothetical protein